MTCRCGYQFCYVCGERWRTCHCIFHVAAQSDDDADEDEDEDLEEGLAADDDLAAGDDLDEDGDIEVRRLRQGRRPRFEATPELHEAFRIVLPNLLYVVLEE
jgi:hypothetical protein